MSHNVLLHVHCLYSSYQRNNITSFRTVKSRSIQKPISETHLCVNDTSILRTKRDDHSIPFASCRIAIANKHITLATATDNKRKKECL